MEMSVHTEKRLFYFLCYVQRNNNLALNTKKTKKRMWRVSCFGFLGTYITEDLTWTLCLSKTVQHGLYFLLTLSQINVA